MRNDLAPRRLLAAYAVGIFPMADDFGELHWLAPDPRCILELDAFLALLESGPLPTNLVLVGERMDR